MVVKYVLMMHMLRTTGSFSTLGLTPARLKRRLAYLTSRYGPRHMCQPGSSNSHLADLPKLPPISHETLRSPHPHDLSRSPRYYWQFVIWGRLLLLTCCTLVPDVVSTVIVTSTASSVEVLTAEDIANEEATEQVMIWTHAAIAAMLLMWFGIWHTLAQPYKWQFQNVIDTALFVADVLCVGLGVIYTVITSYDVGGVDAASSVPANFVEGVLLLVIGGSLFGAAFYLWWR